MVVDEITSIVLHYKRPENVEKWMAGIKNQTVKSKVIVWDNSGDYPNGSGEDILIKSSRNFYCQPRFLIPGFVYNSEYIYTQDDDMAIKDNTLFEKFIDVNKKHPDSAIGWNGRILSKDINWEKSYQSPGKGWIDSMAIDDIRNIDIINTGVCFFRTSKINFLPINPFKDFYFTCLTEEEFKYADDIWASYWFSEKRLMPFSLETVYEKLNEYQERNAALSKQSPHMDYRNKVLNRFFKRKFFKEEKE